MWMLVIMVRFLAVLEACSVMGVVVVLVVCMSAEASLTCVIVAVYRELKCDGGV